MSSATSTMPRPSRTRLVGDPAYRRKISRQLTKRESLHALKRDMPYAHEGTIRARHLEQQTEQAWCLTLVTNAVVTWTTLAHISPAHSENINFFGAIDVDIEANWPNSAPPATGRYGYATPSSDPGLQCLGLPPIGDIRPIFPGYLRRPINEASDACFQGAAFKLSSQDNGCLGKAYLASAVDCSRSV